MTLTVAYCYKRSHTVTIALKPLERLEFNWSACWASKRINQPRLSRFTRPLGIAVSERSEDEIKYKKGAELLDAKTDQEGVKRGRFGGPRRPPRRPSHLDPVTWPSFFSQVQ